MSTVAPVRVQESKESRLALFADCLLLGCMTFAASLAIVTAYPAFTAACQLLRRRTREESSVSPRTYLAQLRTVLAANRIALVIPPVAVLVLLLDMLALQRGGPNRAVMLPLLLVIGGGLGLVGLRAASGWSPGRSWRSLARGAVVRSVCDPLGSALLLGAVAASVLITRYSPVQLPLVLGPLALAVVVVEDRRSPAS